MGLEGPAKTIRVEPLTVPAPTRQEPAEAPDGDTSIFPMPTGKVTDSHWYRVHWCPVCGAEERERVYGEKPSDPDKRHSVTYCGCLDSQFA